eukprot:c15783_g1_i1.p1 GENE.c15783_g1_i1~~c15783_g1_i1.p1  ORF type:complete len:628 (-),score=263.34 c15783_g1_i1:541-2328(-)
MEGMTEQEKREERKKRKKSRWEPESVNNQEVNGNNQEVNGNNQEQDTTKKRRKGWDQQPTQIEGQQQIQQNPQTLMPPISMTQQQQQQPATPPAVLAVLKQHQETQAQKQARKLYVGGILPTMIEQDIVTFFNETIVKLHPEKYEEGPVIAASINHDKSYAFIDFKTPEDATSAMSLDGVIFQNQTLKIRRPKDYQPIGGSDETQTISAPETIPTMVPESPHKIFIGSIPPFLNDEQVKELLTAFGPLCAFHLVKDSSTGLSKGYAFALYKDTSITDKACEGLSAITIGGKTLVVKRANVKVEQTEPAPIGEISVAAILNMSIPFQSILQWIPGNPTGAPVPPTKILVLLNLVDDEDLEKEESYTRLKDDISLECGRFGTVVSVEIPKPQFVPARKEVQDALALTLPGSDIPKYLQEKSPQVSGQRKIFVEYSDVESAQKAAVALGGRRYNMKTCITTFWDEERFKNKQFDMQNSEEVFENLRQYALTQPQSQQTMSAFNPMLPWLSFANPLAPSPLLPQIQAQAQALQRVLVEAQLKTFQESLQQQQLQQQVQKSLLQLYHLHRTIMSILRLSNQQPNLFQNLLSHPLFLLLQL